MLLKSAFFLVPVLLFTNQTLHAATGAELAGSLQAAVEGIHGAFLKASPDQYINSLENYLRVGTTLETGVPERAEDLGTCSVESDIEPGIGYVKVTISFQIPQENLVKRYGTQNASQGPGLGFSTQTLTLDRSTNDQVKKCRAQKGQWTQLTMHNTSASANEEDLMVNKTAEGLVALSISPCTTGRLSTSCYAFSRACLLPAHNKR